MSFANRKEEWPSHFIARVRKVTWSVLDSGYRFIKRFEPVEGKLGI